MSLNLKLTAVQSVGPYLRANLIVKNIVFKPVRSILTVFGVAIACSVFLLILHIIEGHRNSWIELFTNRGIDLFIMEKGKVDPLTSSLDSSITERLLELKYVRSAIGSLADILSLNEEVNILVIGYERDSSAYNQFVFLEGRRPWAKGEIAIGPSVKQTTGLKAGDVIKLKDRNFTITGIFEASSLFEANSIIIDIDALRDMRQVGEVFSSIGVQLRLGFDYKTAVEKIKFFLAREYPTAKVNVTADFFSNNRMFQSLEHLVSIISLLALGLIILSCMNTLGTAVFERKGEIAMLRIIGWSRSSIALSVLGESFLLSLFGWTIGTGIAFLSSTLMMSQDLFLFMNPEGFGSNLILRSALLCIIGGIVGALHPTFIAMRLDPADAFTFS